MVENPFLPLGFHILPSFCPSLCLCHLKRGSWCFFSSCFYAVICSYLHLHLHVKIYRLAITLHRQFSHRLFHPDLFALQIFGLDWNCINIPGVPCNSIHTPSLGPFLCCSPSHVSGYFSRSLQGPAVSRWWPDLFTSWLS